MTDNAAVLQRVLLAKETTPGTSPASGYRELGSLTLTPAPQLQAETFKPQGQLWATAGGVNQEHTQVAVSGRGAYNELPFPLAGLIKDVSPTTPSTAVLTRRFTYRASHNAEDTPATYAMQRGTSRRSEEASYLLFNSLQFAYTRQNGLQLSGQALARLLKDNMVLWLTTSGGPSSGNGVLVLELLDSPALPIITAPIAYNASAADVEAALNALATIGANGVSVSGSAGGPYTVTFDGTDVAGRPQDLIELYENSLTGGTNPSVSITEDTAGAEPATDEVQEIEITGTPTNGTFRLRLRTCRTKGFAHNASAATIQSALELTPAVASGDVSVSGGALSTNPVRIGFTGRYLEAPPPTVTGTDSFNAGDLALATLFPSPTTYGLIPILGKHFSWYIARSYAALASASKLTRMLQAQWGLQDRWGVFFPMNDDNESFAGHIVTDPNGEVSFTIGADSNGMQYLPDLRRGDTIFLRGLAQGPVIETIGSTVFRHYFQVTLALKLTNISERKAEQNLVAVTYTGTLAYDATFGTALECEVQTTLTTL